MARKDIDFYNRGRIWNPLREMNSLQRGIDRVFQDFFDVAPADFQMPLGFNPAVDVEESEDHYLISVDLPGVSKDDVKVELKDHQIVISGERKEEKRDTEKNRYFIEKSYGSFQRSFTLPSDVDPNKIEADYRDGVLKIGLPKSEAAKAKTIEIGSSKSGLLTKGLGEEKKSGSKKEVA